MSGGAKLRPAKGTAVILRSERGYYAEIRVQGATVRVPDHCSQDYSDVSEAVEYVKRHAIAFSVILPDGIALPAKE